MRTTATLHFDERGELRQLAVEVFGDDMDRLALIVPPPLGPFDDPEAAYVGAWERAVAAARRQLPGQLSIVPEAHPRVLLRRAVDPDVDRWGDDAADVKLGPAGAELLG